MHPQFDRSSPPALRLSLQLCSASLVAVILARIACRLVPHPANFTPEGARALFSGATFADRRAAYLLARVPKALSHLDPGFGKTGST